MRTRPTTRPAFTLVEMMIAIALTLVVMLIIAQTFASATKVFSDLRTAGQLQERTRGAAAVIRRDLEAEHFDGPFTPGLSGPRVGDQRLDRPGWTPPARGYFEMRQFLNGLNQTGYIEPIANPVPDSEGLASTRSDTHFLRFTVKLPDVPAAELYCAELQKAPVPAGEPFADDTNPNTKFNSYPIPGSTLVYSRWAEIEYWLQPSPGDVTPATNNGPSLQLYSLRRRVRLLAPAGKTYLVATGRSQQLMTLYPDVAMFGPMGPGPVPGSELLRVLGPDDVNNPTFRLPLPPQVSMKPNVLGQVVPTGDDVLLTDVISFEVKAAWFRNAVFNNLDVPPPGNPPPGFPVGLYGSSPSVPAMALGNTEEPFSDLPPCVLNIDPRWNGQRVFDTWYRAQSADAVEWDRPLQATSGPGFLNQRIDQAPLRINVRALQIKLRVWDSRKEQARQMTIIQEI
jgi:prepilin-type N-terminal cleavage/methylation domain-containing protein